MPLPADRACNADSGRQDPAGPDETQSAGIRASGHFPVPSMAFGESWRPPIHFMLFSESLEPASASLAVPWRTLELNHAERSAEARGLQACGETPQFGPRSTDRLRTPCAALESHLQPANRSPRTSQAFLKRIRRAPRALPPPHRRPLPPSTPFRPAPPTGDVSDSDARP